VVNSALDSGDVEFAAQYIDRNRSTIKAPRLVELEGKVTAETDVRASARIADDVIGSFGGRIPSETEVRQKIAEVTGDNVRVRDAATSEALAQLGSMLRDRERREQEVMAAVFGRLEANGGNLAALPASLRSAIPGDKLGSVRNYADGLRGGGKIETDWDAYYKLRTNPALLRQTNLMALRDRLEDTEFKELIRLQGEASDTPDVAQTEVQTTMQRMNMRLAEIGLDPTPKGKEAAKRVGKAWATLSANIREAEAAAGRKLTPEQRDAQIDRLFASVEVRGSLFGTTDVALFEVEPGKEVVTVTVPEFDRRQITAALRAQGKEVSEANIQYYFKKAQGFIK
jgi:soluble lytic murein transglycosylase